MKRKIYTRIKEGLAVASQLIVTAPVRLPPKVVVVAKYVSLGIALLDAVSGRAASGKEEPDDGI